jgi:uncharacterized membrane protein
MDWPQFVVQWLHVLLAITWFGAALTTNLIFIPAITRLPLDRQREIAGPYGQVASRILNMVAPTVIVLGIIRGTVFGPIRSLDALTTAYGITWLVALVAALATWAWARFRIEPALAKMNAIPVEAALLPDGSVSPEMDGAIATAKRNAVLELIGFFVVFTCMILMRFGY